MQREPSSRTLRTAITAATIAVMASSLPAQDLPTSQPPMLVVFREHVKLGRESEHQKIEAQFSAAMSKAKFPNYFLVLTSITGSSEAWSMVPFASNAAIGEWLKWQPANGAEITRLMATDAGVLTGEEQIHLVSRPELSRGAFPDIAAMRYWVIWIYHVRSGRTAQFDSLEKMYAALEQRAGVNLSARMYAVLLGMPAPTYVMFRSVTSYAGFDDNQAMVNKSTAGATPEESAMMRRLSAESIESIEGNRYALDPAMSYVSPATRAKDPAFWRPKKKGK